MSSNRVKLRKADQKFDYSDPKQVHKSYTLANSVSIKSPIHNLCLLGDQIWCAAGSDGLLVYNLDGEQIQQIKHAYIPLTLGLAEMTPMGDLVIADRYKGLVHLSRHGDVNGVIAEGHCCDVTVHKNIIYGLDFDHCQLKMITEDSDKNWLIIKEVSLQYGSANITDRVCATAKSIYISSCKTHSIYVYSHSGQFQFETGQFGTGLAGRFNLPYVSDTDSLGNIMVCDYENCCLQVFDETNGEWRVLLSMKYPPTATTVGLNEIWVATNSSRKLHKYQKA